MKTRNFGILVIVLTAGGAASQEKPALRCTSTDIPAGLRACTVDIHVRADAKGRCYVTSIDPSEKIRVKKGETVTWRFQNDCGPNLELGVGHFRGSGEFKDKPEEVDKADPRHEKYPFDGDTPRKIKVEKGKPNEFTATVQPAKARNISYKYDILMGRNVLLDPEAEIRPQ